MGNVWRETRQAVRVLLGGLAFLGFGLGALLLGWTLLPLIRLVSPRESGRRRCQRVVQRAFVLFHDYMRWTGLVTFDPRARWGELPTQAAVVIANHPTLVDVTAIIATFGELCVVAKAPLFRNPLIGPLLLCCGHIRGQAALSEDGVSVIHEGVARLHAGHKVLMFPEGTRSPEVGMRRFRNGAFHLATTARVPVVPIHVSAEPPGLKKGDPWYRLPRTAIVMRLAVLPTVGPFADVDSRALSAKARQQLQAAIDAHTAARP